MDQTIAFMNGPWGRAARAALGVILVAAGLLGLGGTLLAVVGLVPLAMAAWGHCLLEPFARPAR